MKALTTAGLTKLIQLIKSSFISNTDTVTTNTVTIATVATSGSYNDLSNKPTIGNGTITFTQGGVTKGTITTNQTGNSTIALDAGGTVDQTFDGTSTNAQSGIAIAGELTNYVLSDSSNSIDIYSGTSIGFNAPETTDITANGLPIITSYNILSNDVYLTIGEYSNNYGIYLYDVDYIKFFYAEDGGSGLSAYSSNRQSHYAIDLLPSSISFENEDYTTTITIPADGSLALNGNAIATQTWVGSQGYTTNLGTVTSVNNVQPDNNGNVSVSIPVIDQTFDGTSANGQSGVAIIDLLETIYPIGSIYIGTMATCPLATLGVGTWQLVSSGKVLQGADSTHTAGSDIAAGLPNITGSITSRPLSTQYTGAVTGATGAFTYTRNGASGTTSPITVSGTTVNADVTQLNASHSNSIYGNSTTVQPPAYAVNIWERIS